MKKSRILLEKQLIFGWNSKIHIIIDEYAKSMREGSSIDIVVSNPDRVVQTQITAAQERYKNIKINLLSYDQNVFDFLTQLDFIKYDTVLVPAEESGVVEDVDLKTVSLLMEFRYAFENLERPGGQPLNINLVTEVIDSEKADVFLKAGAKDFLIPHKFVSELIAQISQQPDLKKIYDHLFEEAGSEFYVKPIELYFKNIPVTASFADCMLAAQNRGEVCLGVRIGSEETNIERNYGLYLPPDKNIIFDLNESDSLVTLAENRN